MKKIILTLSLVIAACGGGGGGDGAREACENYCAFACNKVAACVNASSAEANICTNSCINAFENNQSFDEEGCKGASNTIASMNCAQLINFINNNLRSTGETELSYEACGGNLAEKTIE